MLHLLLEPSRLPWCSNKCAMFFSTSYSCNVRAIGGSRFGRTKLVSHCFSSRVLTVASLAT